MASFGLALVLAANWGVAGPPDDPERVVGGTDAAACEYPAAASGLRFDGSHACTVAVVHPRVVLLAAHCVPSGPLATVVFGENSYAPEVEIPIAACEAHPNFIEVDDTNLWDLAYCTLTEDAPAVPMVPPLMGCEADQLVPGADVTLAGYGLNDEPNVSGAGVKRWTTNTVEAVIDKDNDLFLLGDNGASVCFGDSGGPAYMQLDDGSWRIVGITSEAHPDVKGEPTVCGYGAIYDLVHLEMQWFEQQTGYDLTPCFDADGTWAPDENCGGFPTSLTTPALSWDAACVSDEISGFSATCGEPFDDGTGGSSSGGSESSSSGDGDTTGTPGGTMDAESTSSGAPADPTTSGSSSSETGAAPEGDGNGDEGCGCDAGSRGGAGGVWLLGLLFAISRRPCPARRRRRRGAREACTRRAADRRRG